MIPEKVIVSATGQNKPGLAVILRFKMSKKNDFYYLVFLDSDGKAQIGKGELLESFDHDRNLFLMDYVDPRIAFTGQIEAHALTEQEVEQALQEYGAYKRHVSYPPNYFERLKSALTINPGSSCIISVKQDN